LRLKQSKRTLAELSSRFFSLIDLLWRELPDCRLLCALIRCDWFVCIIICSLVDTAARERSPAFAASPPVFNDLS
jgi:hypothetical protein